MKARLPITWLFLLLAAACSDDAATTPDAANDVGADGTDTNGEPDVPHGEPGATVAMDFTRAGGFYSAPFPDESRRTNEGMDLTDFPNPQDVGFVRQVLALLESERGFSVDSAIFFQLSDPVDVPVLTPGDTVLASSPFQLIGIDAEAPDYGRRYPIEVLFEGDAGPFGDDNLLSLLPIQGIPLREETLYAALITRDLTDRDDRELGVPPALTQLLAGERPEGLSEVAFESYQTAIAAIEALDVDAGRLAGLAVFRTNSPTRELLMAREQLREAPAPTPNAPLAQTDVFDDYCVYASTIDMPTFQAGEPPYLGGGGGWEFDEDGLLISQGTEEGNLVVTVPRAPMPEDGFPTVVFIRVGGGGDRPLVDRGVRDAEGNYLETGRGPAEYIAQAGWAGISIDGPHGVLRNVSNGDEQLLIFNVGNPLALRDNIRQSALESALAADILEALSFAVSDCEGLDTGDSDVVHFDVDQLAVMGHSMGATIAIPTLAIEPRFDAMILSGCGGSYIENVVHKLSPLEVRPFAEAILRYNTIDRSLHEHDPVLTLLQWAGDPSDPPPYGRLIIREAAPNQPRHVLMLQGIVDTYILPSIANAASLSMGLDLAGPSLDAESAELEAFTPLDELIGFVDRSTISLPVQGNLTVGDTDVTAIVVQHNEDGVEDGHEIAFQRDLPKVQYRCFLESLLEGTPRVPADGTLDGPCP